MTPQLREFKSERDSGFCRFALGFPQDTQHRLSGSEKRDSVSLGSPTRQKKRHELFTSCLRSARKQYDNPRFSGFMQWKVWSRWLWSILFITRTVCSLYLHIRYSTVNQSSCQPLQFSSLSNSDSTSYFFQQKQARFLSPSHEVRCSPYALNFNCFIGETIHYFVFLWWAIEFDILIYSNIDTPFSPRKPSNSLLHTIYLSDCLLARSIIIT